MAARLATGLLPPLALAADIRERRADRAKHWVTTLAMPNPARMALLRAFDATAQPAVNGTSASAFVGVAEALAELARTLTGHLDAPSQQELLALADALRESRPRIAAA